MCSTTSELQHWEPGVRRAGHPAREAPSWTLHPLPSRGRAYWSEDFHSAEFCLIVLWWVPQLVYGRILKILLSLLCYHVNCSRVPVKPVEWCSCSEHSPACKAPGLSWRTEAQAHIPRHLGGPARSTLRVANTGRTVSREMLNLHNPAFCAGEWCFVLPWNSTFNIADIVKQLKKF